MTEQVNKDQASADKVRRVVVAEEQDVAAANKDVELARDSAQAELKAVTPMYKWGQREKEFENGTLKNENENRIFTGYKFLEILLHFHFPLFGPFFAFLLCIRDLGFKINHLKKSRVF